MSGTPTGRGWRNDGTFHLMRRVMQRHNAIWRERLPGLTPVQYSVLLSIRNLPGADQKAVGAASAVEPTTMANLVARMEKGGLVVRTPDPRDGRRRRLGLTAAGRKELKAATPVVRSIRDDFLALIPAADAAQLRRVLGGLARAGEGTSDDSINQESECGA